MFDFSLILVEKELENLPQFLFFQPDEKIKNNLMFFYLTYLWQTLILTATPTRFSKVNHKTR